MRKVFLLAALLLSTIVVMAQGDTLASVVFEKTEADTLKTLGHWGYIYMILVTILVIIAPILTYFGIRSRIEKWAEDEITKKASEKVGVEWGIVKQLVAERKTLLEKRGKLKIAIINETAGERSELRDLLTGLGFPTPKFFRLDNSGDNSFQYFDTQFKRDDFNCIIFDNEDGKMKDETIVKIAEECRVTFKNRIIWYTPNSDTSFYGAFTKEGGAVIKKSSRFQMELDNRLL